MYITVCFQLLPDEEFCKTRNAQECKLHQVCCEFPQHVELLIQKWVDRLKSKRLKADIYINTPIGHTPAIQR